ncbi:hypothetical protein GLAREA_00082 [Glarea lozoyensis ATCC 20868]|uniref:Uncharacterized protein n=1 Tax=Glarea lozoyensis (strain ATCC 20868 / MF5171) TaxID=1116229 RepID=S3CVE3_GLAL2|nr:uncharacterized protein GLAREA_00082 [Glarea lozoyensis ATCC 20868]EPE28924.1 hypothetical protein GLAREA_00082 [Glarea lozoyensis ATCC 20868]
MCQGEDWGTGDLEHRVCDVRGVVVVESELWMEKRRGKKRSEAAGQEITLWGQPMVRG